VGLLGFLAWREHDMPTGEQVSPSPPLSDRPPSVSPLPSR
jgi:hypothetical protein